MMDDVKNLTEKPGNSSYGPALEFSHNLFTYCEMCSTVLQIINSNLFKMCIFTLNSFDKLLLFSWRILNIQDVPLLMEI